MIFLKKIFSIYLYENLNNKLDKIFKITIKITYLSKIMKKYMT